MKLIMDLEKKVIKPFVKNIHKVNEKNSFEGLVAKFVTNKDLAHTY